MTEMNHKEWEGGTVPPQPEPVPAAPEITEPTQEFTVPETAPDMPEALQPTEPADTPVTEPAPEIPAEAEPIAAELPEEPAFSAPAAPPVPPQPTAQPPYPQMPYPAPQTVSYVRPVPYTVAEPGQTYAAPGYPPYAQAVYPAAPPEPKRKMAVGLKILIIVMIVLFAGSVLGFTAYGIYALVTNPTYDSVLPDTDYLPDDFDVLPFEEPEEIPSEDEKEPEPEQNTIVIPDIDVVPNTDGIQLHNVPAGPEMDITDIYDKVMPSTVLVIVTAETGSGTGTGIIATEDGYVITNSHVVLNSRNVQVELKTSDGKLHPAVVVGFDKTTDLAVLKMEGSGFTPAEFGNSDALRMGEWVVAIGNPGGEQFSGSITRGIISGLGRSVGSYSANGMTYIQTDTAINPGNSGGPLVNLHGQVVGINSAKIVSDQYEGMGFAIPITGAKSIVDDLLSGGYVQGRVRMGIRGYVINEMQAAFADVKPGFMIAEFDPDSPFLGTQVQVDDIIVAIDDMETPSLEELANVLLNYEPGDTVTVTLIRPNESGRGGEEFEVTIVLLEDKGETQG
ncbi:MAG: trypsin-like peptidase domain-containing protein [Clostridia bacterium]|nr:trypsin-like peptidase domain-containing protein [Clostridia bacterium]